MILILSIVITITVTTYLFSCLGNLRSIFNPRVNGYPYIRLRTWCRSHTRYAKPPSVITKLQDVRNSSLQTITLYLPFS
ncbi:hypothetical protein EB796_021576 [Bugula neritina]|uniref:Uncharacterized protein n=1 Tax=Bugula neritina TaxID=10212 RepID=A0A7J7J376_BUGNE|nr:hypothetical protein EB796_021576 [Bugula neritina]